MKHTVFHLIFFLSCPLKYGGTGKGAAPSGGMAHKGVTNKKNNVTDIKEITSHCNLSHGERMCRSTVKRKIMFVASLKVPHSRTTRYDDPVSRDGKSSD